MPKASVTRKITREKQKLINFVLDIEKYPEFIPFCIDSKIYERVDKEDRIVIIADLTIGKKPFIDTYKSDVRYNKWKFIQRDDLTEVYFDVDFEIKNKFLDMIMTKSFQFGLNKIADAFQERAEKL